MDNKSEYSTQTILAISGSTRQCSTNLDLINSIIQLYSHQLNIRIFKGLNEIPHFNPDLDTDNPPINVLTFRRQLREADAILICTPEYAMGVPGTLKNAIDWTVSSMELSHKPIALIVASTAGQKAYQSLMETLRILEGDIPDVSSVWISHAKAKIKGDKIVDTLALNQIRKVMDSLIITLENKRERNI